MIIVKMPSAFKKLMASFLLFFVKKILKTIDRLRQYPISFV